MFTAYQSSPYKEELVKIETGKKGGTLSHLLCWDIERGPLIIDIIYYVWHHFDVLYSHYFYHKTGVGIIHMIYKWHHFGGMCGYNMLLYLKSSKFLCIYVILLLFLLGLFEGGNQLYCPILNASCLTFSFYISFKQWTWKKKRWKEKKKGEKSPPPYPHPGMFGPNVTYTLGSSLHITEIWTFYVLHIMGICRPWQCCAFIVIIKQCGSSQTHNVGPCKAVWYTVPTSLMWVKQQTISVWVLWTFTYDAEETMRSFGTQTKHIILQAPVLMLQVLVRSC